MVHRVLINTIMIQFFRLNWGRGRYYKYFILSTLGGRFYSGYDKLFHQQKNDMWEEGMKVSQSPWRTHSHISYIYL